MIGGSALSSTPLSGGSGVSSLADVTHSDVLAIDDAIGFTTELLQSTADTLGVRDALGDEDLLIDFLRFSDAFEVESDWGLTDRVRISTPLDLPELYQQGITEDTVAFVEILVVDAEVFTVDVVRITDSVADIALPAPLHDWVRVVDSLTASLDVQVSVIDSVRLTDALAGEVSVPFNDTLALSETVSGTADVIQSFADLLQASDALAGIQVHYAALQDRVAFGDGAESVVSLEAELSDVVLIQDAIYDAVRQKIIAINAETGGTSHYQVAATITGLMEYQGVLYLAGPGGLYAMDVLDDDEGRVVWGFRTGFSNLGNDRLKRVNDVNVQGRTHGETVLEVVTNRDGEKEANLFQLPVLERMGYRDGLIAVGRGCHSVYWQMALYGTGPSEIDQLHVVTETLSSRR